MTNQVLHYWADGRFAHSKSQQSVFSCFAPVPFWLKAFSVPKRTTSENSTDLKRKDGLLTVYNRPLKIDFYHCNRVFKGVKMPLKCNQCGIYYGYSKYGNPTSGWNLYDSPRIAIEASDVCFVQHRIMEWQVSLVQVCFSCLTVTDYFSIFMYFNPC